MAAMGESKRNVPRSLEFAQFAIGFLWLLAARAGADSAAQGFSRLIGTEAIHPLLQQIFLLILLVTGVTALHWVATRNGSIGETNALRLRPTMTREWQKGAAFGWALLLITLIPMAVVGDLHPQFWLAPRAWGSAVLALITLFVGGLATEMAFRGYLFQRLIAATGPVTATVLLSAVTSFLVTSPQNYTPFSFGVAFISSVLFCVAYLRTHALWLGWGIRFGWLASMGVLFGLPLAGSVDFASVVATDSSGRTWLTGGAYGPEGAVFTGLALLAGIVVLYSLTRDYAWVYTHSPIVPGGYPMDVPPPAAHAAMETAADRQLVQILGATPSAGATSSFAPQPPVVSVHSTGRSQLLNEGTEAQSPDGGDRENEFPR